jgi:hypothetical protein
MRDNGMTENRLVLAEFAKLMQVYEVLINLPQPEEEEEAQKQLFQIFTTLKSQLDENSDSSQEISQLLFFTKKWDPLESWFTELSDLPRLLRILLKRVLPDQMNALASKLSVNSKSLVNENRILDEMKSNSPQTEDVSLPISENIQVGNSEENVIDTKTKAKINRRLEQIEKKMSSFFQSSNNLSQTSKGSNQNNNLDQSIIQKPQSENKSQETSLNSKVTSVQIPPNATSKKSILIAPRVVLPNSLIAEEEQPKPIPITITPTNQQPSFPQVELEAGEAVEAVEAFEAIDAVELFEAVEKSEKAEKADTLMENEALEIVPTTNPLEDIAPTSSFHPVFKQIRVTSEKHNVSRNIPEIEKMEDFDPSQFVNLAETPNPFLQDATSVEKKPFVIPPSISPILKPDIVDSVPRESLYQQLLLFKSKKAYCLRQLDEIEDQLYSKKMKPKEFKIQLKEINAKIVKYASEIEKVEAKLK